MSALYIDRQEMAPEIDESWYPKNTLDFLLDTSKTYLDIVLKIYYM